MNTIFNNFFSDAGIRIWSAGIAVGIINAVLTYLFSRTSKSKIEMLKTLKEIENLTVSEPSHKDLTIIRAYKMADLINFENNVIAYKTIFSVLLMIFTATILSFFTTTWVSTQGGLDVVWGRIVDMLFGGHQWGEGPTLSFMQDVLMVTIYLFSSWIVPLSIIVYIGVGFINLGLEKPNPLYLNSFYVRLYLKMDITRSPRLFFTIPFNYSKMRKKVEKITKNKTKSSVYAFRVIKALNVLANGLCIGIFIWVGISLSQKWQFYISSFNKIYLNNPDYEPFYFWGTVFSIGFSIAYVIKFLVKGMHVQSIFLLKKELKQPAISQKTNDR